MDNETKGNNNIENRSPMQSIVKTEYPSSGSSKKHLVIKSKDKHRTDRRRDVETHYKTLHKSNNHLLMIAPPNECTKIGEPIIKKEIVDDVYRVNDEEDARCLPNSFVQSFQMHRQAARGATTVATSKFDGPSMFKNNFLSVQIDMPKNQLSVVDKDRKCLTVERNQNTAYDSNTSTSFSFQKASCDSNSISLKESTEKPVSAGGHQAKGFRAKKRTQNKNLASNEKRRN